PESQPLSEKKEILKSASIISLVTIVSRVLGYVRDQRITLLLGTTLSAASFVPVFTTYMRERSKEELWEFANKLFWTLALVLAVITVLGVIFSRQVIAPFSTSGWNEAIALNRIIFPYLFFVGLAALGMGILNCFQHFALPASTTVLLNLSIIAFSTAVVWRYFQSPAVSLAVGVLVGGAL